jgi:hypothetical protein
MVAGSSSRLAGCGCRVIVIVAGTRMRMRIERGLGFSREEYYIYS